MSTTVRLSLFIAGLMLVTGCQNTPSTVAEVPPPTPSGPITATHDPGLAGPQPVALSSNTKKPAAYNDGDIFTQGGNAAPAPLPTGGGGQHIVRQGETLWSISKAHYGTGQRWKDIIAANPGLTPERMQVGMAIVLP